MRRLLFTLFLITGIALEAKPLSVSVKAKSAILYNPENGAILFEKGAHEPFYPASILKFATALYVLETQKDDLDRKCLASAEALRVINAEVKQKDPLLYPPYLLEHDGITIGLLAGKSYSIRTLLHGMLLASGNDASNVIAENCGGSIEGFMRQLNKYLKAKGILQTRFQNPSGLHHPAQMTTAYDMAKIAELCFEDQLFREIILTKGFETKEWEANLGTLVNTNGLLKEGSLHYPKFIGGKTGYTSSSGYNLVAAAEDKGRRLIVVLLGCESDIDRYKDAITLFESAFCQRSRQRTLLSKEHESFTRYISKADGTLEADLNADVKMEYFPSEEMELSVKIKWHKARLPIKVGDEVGHLIVENEQGKVAVSAPIYAKNRLARPAKTYGIWAFGICVILLVFLKFYKQFTKIRKR